MVFCAMSDPGSIFSSESPSHYRAPQRVHDAVCRCRVALFGTKLRRSFTKGGHHMGATETLARWIATTQYEDIPAAAIEQAKKSLLDYIGTATYGTTSE